MGTAGIVMNKGTISTGFLHFRPPDKASGLLFKLILDSIVKIYRNVRTCHNNVRLKRHQGELYPIMVRC